MRTFASKSSKETMRLGRRLAENLNKGDVVALIGELGSGKTTFTKGVAEGLGVRSWRYVNSPSFVIVKAYRGTMPLYHMDLYRLDGNAEMETVGYEEYLWSDGVCVVEWADKIMRLLPNEYVKITITFTNHRERLITVIPRGQRLRKRIAKL
jgi:tRNA threonylcarbamoyladenosine biosynthesis protein TsaE